MNIDEESVTTLEDLRGDLAHRYKWAPSGGNSVDSAIVEADLAALDRDGYVVWENLLSTEDCRDIRQVVRPWLGHTGRNSFEGRRTQRIYSVLSRTRVCDSLVDNPRVLAVLDRLLMPNYLLSALQAISIQPGEAAQLAHHDDGFYPIPRPRASGDSPSRGGWRSRHSSLTGRRWRAASCPRSLCGGIASIARRSSCTPSAGSGTPQ